MPKLCNVDIEHRKEIYEGLKEFVTELKRKFPVKEVYLYGSFAKNEIHEGSDIDLIVVGEIKGKMFERIKIVADLTNLPVEPLVYTQEEFKTLRKTNPFLKNILRTAKKL